ncbi:MAG: FecR domain-containing protein [bacterium]|nr:FecR domain-containing protein [bacterium]
MSFEKLSNRSRSRQMRFAGICSLSLVLLGGIYLTANEAIQADRNVARVVRLLGKARVKSEDANKWRPLRVGSIVKDGDHLETGPNSQMILRYKTIEMRLGPKTKTRVDALLDASKPTKIHVSEGYSWFNVKKGKVKGPVNFKVTTPTAIASVRGTKFSVVEDDDGALSCVCEGKVDTSAKGEGDDVERAVQGDSHSFSKDGARQNKDFAKYFRGLKVDRSFQKLIDADERLSYCGSCHKMTDLASDNTPDPSEY